MLSRNGDFGDVLALILEIKFQKFFPKKIMSSTLLVANLSNSNLNVVILNKASNAI